MPFNILKPLIFAKKPEIRKNEINGKTTCDDIAGDTKNVCAIINNQQMPIDADISLRLGSVMNVGVFI